MGQAPLVSVIIAAYHSDSVIADCLTSLGAQTFRDFEAIVVNSSPDDGTRATVTAGFPQVTFLEHPTRLLPHAARNKGVAVAVGQVLVFTDADCRAMPDWLDRCVAATRAGHAVVCGSIEPAESTWYALGVHLCKSSFRLSNLREGVTSIAGTANACYSRAVWDAIGPFDADLFAGDALLSWRATQHGWQPWFEPRAVVRHVFQHSLAEFWRERIDRGADFGRARAVAERWSRLRLAASVLAFPALPVIPLARGFKEALASGWTTTYFGTFPIQILGHLGWSLGEARAAWALLTDTRTRR